MHKRIRWNRTATLIISIALLALSIGCARLSGFLPSSEPTTPTVRSPVDTNTLPAATRVATISITADPDYPAPDVLQRSVVYSNPSILHNVYEKLRTKEHITIGFLGGSITEGALSTTPGQRYSWQLVKYLNARYGSLFTELNAGIGSTDSVTGVFRIERDLFDVPIDLIILEYAVNDWGSTEQKIAYEDLIRRSLLKHIAVLCLFTMADGGQNQQSWQSDLCQRYNVPAISYRDAYYPLIRDGTWTWDKLTPDHIHPNDLGHKLISLLVFDYLVKTLSVEPPAYDWSLPSALYGDDFMVTAVYQYGDSTAILLNNDGWSVEATPPADYFGGDAISSDQPGSSYKLGFSGRSLAISYSTLQFSANGMLDVFIDDQYKMTLDAFQQRTFLVQQTDVIARGLADGEHTVEVRISSNRNPRSRGHYFRVIAFLIGK